MFEIKTVYSERNEFAGLFLVAWMDLPATAIKAIAPTEIPAIPNVHQSKFVWWAKFFSHSGIWSRYRIRGST